MLFLSFTYKYGRLHLYIFVLFYRKSVILRNYIYCPKAKSGNEFKYVQEHPKL